LLRAIIRAYRALPGRRLGCSLFGRLSLTKIMPEKQIQTVRMAEIAQHLGVASSTISRALRNAGIDGNLDVVGAAAFDLVVE